jgi:DNA-binding NarL/FixJ family response regulator
MRLWGGTHVTATQPIRVLLVEDNPSDAEILTEVLTYAARDQFTVEWVERAGNGAERLRRVPRIDVVLLDLKLPDADGLDALDSIRGIAPDVPVLVMTGFDDDMLACESKRRGASGYLVKGRFGAERIRSLLVDCVAGRHLDLPARASG